MPVVHVSRSAPWPVLPALLLAAATVHAQDAPSPRFTSDVVVTAERDATPQADVPAATVVLDQAALQALPSVFLGETLSFLPGFQVGRGEFHNGRPTVSARGFFGGGEAEYVLLLVDGVPIADSESGLVDWSLVPAAGIRRVEALRGPGASAYGDSSIGGVIQVLTDQRAAHGSLTGSAGSFGTLTTDGAFGRRLRTTGFDVSGAVRRTDGFALHAGGRHAVARGGVDGQWRGAQWRATGSAQRRENQDPGALTLETARMTPRVADPLYARDQATRRGVTASFGLQRAGAAWSHEARVFTNRRTEDATRTILLAPGLGDGQTRDLSSAAVGGTATIDRTVGSAARPGVVRAGLDVSRERLETSYSPAAFAEGTRARAGVFASGAWSLTPRVRASGALRFDRVADRGFAESAGAPSQTAWSPRAGITVALRGDGAVTAFAQGSRAFKAPTLDQRFDPRPYPDFRGGTFTVSNAALAPQRAGNVEGGVRGSTGRLDWSALGYWMTVNDEIDFDLRTFRYANIGRSRHSGAEVEVRARTMRVQPFATYALTRVGTPGSPLQLKNVPRHAATLGAALSLGARLSGYVRYRMTAGSFADDANTVRFDTPRVVDLRLRQAVGRHALFLDATNATNHVFQEYGFTLADFLGRSVAYAWPGAPRAIRAGAQFAF